MIASVSPVRSSQSPASAWPSRRSGSVSIAYAVSRTSELRNKYSSSSGYFGAGARLTSSRASSSSSHARAVSSRAPPSSAVTPPRQNVLAEHAGRAQHAPRIALDALEPPLDDGEHGLGHRVTLALGDRADQLLEIERVAGRLIEDARDERACRVVAEHAADEPLEHSCA